MVSWQVGLVIRPLLVQTLLRNFKIYKNYAINCWTLQNFYISQKFEKIHPATKFEVY